MAHGIDYGNLMHSAMRELIKKVLRLVAQNGLPGNHHFFITFDTRVPGVEIADWLHERYPEEMTIVVQNWFENLVVEEDYFSITLNFGDAPEPLLIPYNSIHTFVDPSVEFGLRFETHQAALDEAAEDGAPSDEADTDTPVPLAEVDADEPAKDAEVVSLDSFRK